MATLQAPEHYKILIEKLASDSDLEKYKFKTIIVDDHHVELETIINNRKLIYPLTKDYDYSKIKAWLISALKTIEQEDDRDETIQNNGEETDNEQTDNEQTDNEQTDNEQTDNEQTDNEDEKDGGIMSQLPSGRTIAVGVGGTIILGSIVGLSIYSIKSLKAIDASPQGDKVTIDNYSSDESL
jgi:hypothetical protein